MVDRVIFSNNATTTLAVAINGVETALTVTDGANFKSPVAGEYQKVTLDDETNIEIVHVTGRVGNILTVLRAQEGTSGVPFAIGITVEARLTEDIMDQLPQGFDNGGNAKGTDSVNLQPGRTTADQVASSSRTIAVGLDSKASGTDSLAIGYGADSSGTYSVALGKNANTNGGTDGIAIGVDASAIGTRLIAIGDTAVASASNAIAIGNNPDATAADAIAIGQNAQGLAANGIAIGKAATTSTHTDSVIIGNTALASGIEGVAIGLTCNAGSYAVAIGSNALATGSDSIAIGEDAVANDSDCIAMGKAASATGSSSIALGDNTVSSSFETVAIGEGAQALAEDAIGIGDGAVASANYTVAIGSVANARVQKTTHLTSPLIVPRDDGESDLMRSFSAAEVVLFSDEIDLAVTADDVAVITLPTGCKFFANECGVLITVENTVTVDPNIEFGITGTTALFLAATTVTKTVVAERTRFETLLNDDGQTTLTASVETGATATTLTGRVYWKGILVEDE